MTDHDAGNQVAEKLVGALMKIGATMTDISKAQTAITELLKAIHEEQREQRAAMERLAELIEGERNENYRPN